MKKIITSFILTLAVVFGLIAMTPGVYANESGSIRFENPSNSSVLGYAGDYFAFLAQGNDVLIINDGTNSYEGTAFGIYAQPGGGFFIEEYTTLSFLDGIFNSVTISTYNPNTSSEGSNLYTEPFVLGSISVKTIKVVAVKQHIVPDNTRPAISGQENFVTSVDDPKTVNYFQSFLVAIDETDGNITSSIYVVNDNYTPNKAVLGTYEITFGVKDTANNESTLLVYVTVADVTKPVITGNTSKAQISYTQTWNVSTFKSSLTITDNYDTLTNTNIVVHSDNYTANKSILGTYNVVYRGTDSSGNYVDFTKQVEVIDDVAPIVNGPTALTKPTTSILTLAEIKAQLTATDAKEGNLTSSITVVEDNYTGNGNKVGNYTITFRVADSKGNATTHVITVTVVDNIPPIWYIQDGVSIKIVPPATITRQQIIDILVATGQLNVTSTMQINFTQDTYTGNETTPGVYMMSLAYQDTSGNEGIHSLSLTVLDDEDNDDPIIVTPKPSVFESIGQWIGNNVHTVTILGGLVLIGVLFLIYKPKKKKYRRK